MEELKIVMEAIAQLGQAGKEAFVWWLVLTYGTKILTSMMVLTGALGVPWLILRTVRQSSSRNEALTAIGKDLGVDYYYWADSDYEGHDAKAVLAAFKASRGKQ